MASINAREELLNHIENRVVEYIKIVKEVGYDEEPLRLTGSLEEVLPNLGFVYDDGFGGQELYGFILYSDGTWSDRGEYDGSEWWQHQERPTKDSIVSSGY